MSAHDVILVPVDLEDESPRMREAALDLGKRLGARILLLHVYRLPPYVYPGIPPEQLAKIREQVAAEAAGALRALSARLGGFTSLLREGDPSTEILAAIDETGASMVIMGTHGRRGLARLFVGSVAEAVARRSPVPVTMVRQGDDDAKTAA